MKDNQTHDDTLATHAGGDVDRGIEIVNPPLYRASTVLYPTAEALLTQAQTYSYGRRGTPTTRALEEALTALESGAETVLLPSGLAAITCALTAVTRTGDHVLISDSVYGPTRLFANTELKRRGIAVTYYDPLIGAGIEALFQPNTRAVFCESPGSQTFEVQDVPAIARVAHAKGALVLIDNTWASPIFLKPLALDADISIQSATKYIAGHSDVMLGAITANAAAANAVGETHGVLGQCVSPDDAYLVLRGLRTLGVRMKRHEENGLAVARWLKQRPEVSHVLHPALPDAPGHAIFARDFLGASGTFAVILKSNAGAAIGALCDHLRYFRIGYSFGGYESLILPCDPTRIRTATAWTSGLMVRLHIGLEDVGDLIADLDEGLACYRKAVQS